MKLIQWILFLVCAIGYGQAVKVDDTGNDPASLVNKLLDNACVQVSNSSISSAESVAYFSNNGGNFPISEGVIIRSGKAKLTEGRYTGENLNSQVNDNGDRDLERLNSRSGQSPKITDVAYLEFDFVPLSSNFNFNFLFASNEYGEWQCVSSDVFAFLLTNLETGETSNLAVIPNTDTPVSVRNIKDNSYNASCESDFPQLFSSYQVDDPAASTINMRGYTKVMNASADIEPGRPYRIRLVIGDSNDAKFDSAIFLEAGSFNANVDLGQDREFCLGDEYVLETGLDTSLYTHSWTYNGQVIENETANSLTVKENGTYGVRVTQNSTKCLVTDEVVFKPLEVTDPVDLKVCDTQSETYFYDLSGNNAKALGLNEHEYEVFYYAYYSDIYNQKPILPNRIREYRSSGNQEIFIKLKNKITNNFCDAVYRFKLLVNDPVEAHKPEPVETCFMPGRAGQVDLSLSQSEILGEQDPSLYLVSFFNSREDAEANKKAIADPGQFRIPSGLKATTAWARVQDNTMPQCFAVVSIDVVLNDPPPVSKLEDVVECSEYILPEIEYGNYFTGPGGSGTPLFAGDVITESGIYYIFNGPDENGCTNESKFKVTIIESYGIGEKYCGQFVVPTPPEGAFYTAPGGPGGTGVELPTGTVLTSSQVIYYYAEIDEKVCRDEAFNIRILPLPPVDMPGDVITCGSYFLPQLEHGDYFTQAGGKGKKLQPGDVITVSQPLYIFSFDGNCKKEHQFHIYITPQLEPVTACGSYELPLLEVGSFFSRAGGQGEEFEPGAIISSSQRVYYFADVTTQNNCTENLSFDLTIIPIPEVSELEDVLLCEDQVYVLPEIAKGSYFTEANREGTELFPGQVIEQTTTLFINNVENGCSNESSFTVEIRPFPEVENFTDIYTCDAYELPVLQHGRYFTKPGGKGTEFHGGDIISSTKTLYVYNAWENLPGCTSENGFTIYVEGIDVGDFEDISVCDAYVLPKLALGNYFTASGGQGTKLKAGQKVTSTQRIYVYASNGTRFICEDEDNFMVTVSYTPQLPRFSNIESCGSYRLPPLSREEYEVGYHWEPGGRSPITAAEQEITIPGNYTIYVYAYAKGNDTCIKEEAFTVTVYPLLDLHIREGTVCRDADTGEVLSEAYLTSGLDPEEFKVDWYFGGKLMHSGIDYAAAEAGEYTVITTKLKPEVGAACNYNPAKVMVWESSKPIITATVTAPFEDIAVVRVNVEQGYGAFEYRLNNGDYQQSNEFYDVGSGVHTITVKGINGNCGRTTLEVTVLKYPKYFTPNNDGFHDTWTIPDLLDNPGALISIFDRYGKLLKVFPPNQNWDGTFNGKTMPPDDYWFRVRFEQDGVPREFKSHLTLMR